jgi:hypothetical protein
VEQSRGEYDFDLHNLGAVAAVEVTESAVQNQKWMSGKISKKKGDSIIEAKYCKKSWIIFATDAKTIADTRKRADECLAKIEQAGTEKFTYLDALTARRQREAGLGRFLILRCLDVLRIFAATSRYNLVRLSPKKHPPKYTFAPPSAAVRSVRAWR